MTRKAEEGKSPEESVSGVVGVDGCTLPTLSPPPVPPNILTSERLAAGRGRLISGNLNPFHDVEFGPKDYTSVPDPQNPGYMTNGLPVIPPWTPVPRTGGRVMKRFDRRRGSEKKVLSTVREWDQESSTEVRYDVEVQCPMFLSSGTCSNWNHRHSHSARRNVDLETAEGPQRVF